VTYPANTRASETPSSKLSIFAPVVVNTYAVFARDLAPLGFKTITTPSCWATRSCR
jgi:hypothetical protein